MRILVLLFLSFATQTCAFGVPSRPANQRSNVEFFSAAPSDVDSTMDMSQDIGNEEERQSIKQKLIQLCASYDRGYGASTSAKQKVDDLVAELELMNPTPINAAEGVDGEYTGGEIPLKGAWRMVWTTALDVLNLGANPVAAPGSIYQVIDPPVATNIIDFIPRAQTLLPTNFPSSLLRAEVKTRTSKRASNSNRVGLVFEAVSLKPVEVFGMKADMLPPFSVNFPQIKFEDIPGVDPETAPGFFDVTYLDDDMLIIKQNAPGGYFVSVKVDDYDP